MSGFHHNIDPTCLEKYAPAWGPSDYDRMNKGQGAFKSGELPPATPDTSMIFNDKVGRPSLRNLLAYPIMNRDIMNSPMFIPLHNETSPRPPTTRHHFGPAHQ